MSSKPPIKTVHLLRFWSYKCYKLSFFFKYSLISTQRRNSSSTHSTVFKNPVCKVYRFQTVDNKWMLVREQMEECTLSFSIPKQLLSLFIQEDMSRWVALKSHFWSPRRRRRLLPVASETAPLTDSAGATESQRYLRKRKKKVCIQFPCSTAM